MARNKVVESIENEVAEMDKPEVIHIELVDRRPSGFIRDLNGKPAGSWGTEHYHELDAPLARFIPAFGYRKGIKKEVRNGKPVETPYNEPIRYIKEQTEISVERQTILGITPSRATKENLIEVKRGEMTVTREGSYIGLFDYLSAVFYNADAQGRSTRADKIFKVVKVGEEEEKFNDYDSLMADALVFVKRFYKKGPKGYAYQEEKIDSLCNLFEVYAETYSGKVTALNALAKKDPKTFLDKAEKFEQTNFALIANALQLNVIQFKDNTLMYVEKGKVCMDLGSETMTQQQKIERAAQLFQTADFAGAWQELQLELDIAQENQLNA